MKEDIEEETPEVDHKIIRTIKVEEVTNFVVINVKKMIKMGKLV